MTSADLLVFLKRNLEINTDYMDADSRNAIDEQLTFYLDSAIAYIQREGIVLDSTNAEDMANVVQYATELYEKRKASDSSQSVPSRGLRIRLNNRLFSQKIQEGEA